MGLKKGDLVEVIGCLDSRFNKFIGERFTLNEKTPVPIGVILLKGGGHLFKQKVKSLLR